MGEMAHQAQASREWWSHTAPRPVKKSTELKEKEVRAGNESQVDNIRK